MPSLPWEPPKRFVKTRLLWSAKQKMETADKSGKIYWILSEPVTWINVVERTYLGEPLPAKDCRKYDPEYLESLLGLRFGFVQGFHDSRNG